MRSAAASRLPAWFGFALLAVLSWGLWTLLSKLVSIALDAGLTHVLSTAGALCVLPLLALRKRTGVAASDGRVKGMAIALLAGVLGGAGNVLVYRALGQGGLTSVITPFTALYPVVTIVLALALLRERIAGAQILGFLLALPAIFLLSLEPAGESEPFSIAGILVKPWFRLSALALVFFGASAALQKLSTNSVSAARSYVGFALGYLAVALVLLGALSMEWEKLTAPLVFYGILSGMFNALGVLFLFAALARGGKASVVVPFTGLYPVLTVALAPAVLGERPAGPQWCGVALAVLSGVLLAREGRADAPRAGGGDSS